MISGKHQILQCSFHYPKGTIEGLYVGIIDGSDYHRPYTPWYKTMNPNDGLIFDFGNNGYLEINDPSNGTKSEAYNIQMVTTSQSTNDTVIGDDGDNYIWSNGGRDIFYGGSGEDWFAVGGEKKDGKLPIDLNIKDYEQNELISLFDFGSPNLTSMLFLLDTTMLLTSRLLESICLIIRMKI